MRSISGGVLLLLSVCLLSCNDSDRDKDIETVASFDNALAENYFQDVFKQIHTIAMRDTILYDTGVVQIPNVCLDSLFKTDSTGAFPVSVFISFGITNTDCADGRRRRGVIVANYSGKHQGLGTTINVTLSGYHVDDISIEGDMVINVGFLGGNRVYNISVTDAVLTGRNVAVEWNSQKRMEWIAGDTTATILDDVFEVRGTASGRNTRGNTFTAEIMNSLTRPMSCNWVVRGSEELEIPNLSTRTVRYGDGTCDNVATATRDLTELQFTMN